MRGILGILHEIYLRFLVWLGAAPPEGFEYMLPDRTIPDEYTLQEGENLFAVARKFGIHYERIAQANGIEDFENITPGQTLKLPPSDWSPEDGPLTQPNPEAEPFEEPIETPPQLEPDPPPEQPAEFPSQPEPDPIEADPFANDNLIEEVETPSTATEPDWLTAPELIPASQAEIDEAEEFLITEDPLLTDDVEWLVAGEALEVAANILGDEDTSEEIFPQPDDISVPESSEVQTTEGEPDSDTDMVFRYAVQRGDTLNSIARRYGLTVKDLVDANSITDPSRIYPDQKLIIPGYLSPAPEPEPESQPSPIPPKPEIGEHFVYTIASGDTLSTIAKRYGVTLREIIEANDIENPNLIRIGQKVIIPGVIKPSGAPPISEPGPELTPLPTPEPLPPQLPSVETSADYDIDPDFPPIGPLNAVRAMYVSYFAIGHQNYRERMFHLLDTTEFNAVIIDAKGDHGWLSYPSHIPLAHDIGAIRPTARDFQEVMAQLKEKDIYTIARIVTFKDNPLANSHPELAVKSTTSTIWQDSENLAWADPFLKPVWDYNIQIAVEATHLGFDEIQFDFIRFPTPSAAGAPQFSQDLTNQTRVAAITSFLSTARGQLNPLGVKIATNTFGYACWREDDTIIGQDIERMGQYLDVLSPMLYPSTFRNGIPGYKFAIAHPYEIVYHSAVRAVNRLESVDCEIRPWIQDFPDYRFDKRVYGKEEIQAQIKGCFDAGSSGFMVWDHRVQYTDGAYAPLKKSTPQPV